MVDNSPYISVLIPDGESDMTLVLQLVHCLSLNKKIKVYIMSSRKHNFLKFSRFVKGYYYFEYENDISWIANIDQLAEKHNIDFIMPVYEYGIHRILKHEEKLRHSDKLCLLPKLDNFESARNKGLLYNHMIKKDLKTLDMDFPLIAKPVTGHSGGKGIKILENKHELFNYFNLYRFDCDIILQRVIEGFDVSCNVLCKDGEILIHTLQKSLSTNTNLKPLTGFNFFEDKVLINELKKLMKSLNWQGVANIDVRYDEENHSYKFLEINPRFWFNVDASAKANINFPLSYLALSLNEEVSIKTVRPMVYFNLKGIIKKVLKNPFYQDNKSIKRGAR